MKDPSLFQGDIIAKSDYTSTTFKQEAHGPHLSPEKTVQINIS